MNKLRCKECDSFQITVTVDYYETNTIMTEYICRECGNRASRDHGKAFYYYDSSLIDNKTAH